MYYTFSLNINRSLWAIFGAFRRASRRIAGKESEATPALGRFGEVSGRGKRGTLLGGSGPKPPTSKLDTAKSREQFMVFCLVSFGIKDYSVYCFWFIRDTLK
jgi:hypothetical protein